jgi:hypothetical protein
MSVTMVDGVYACSVMSKNTPGLYFCGYFIAMSIGSFWMRFADFF